MRYHLLVLSALCAAALTARVWCAEESQQLKNLAHVPLEQRNPVAKEKVWPSEIGQADVCLWKDDKVAAFTLTIDDNTKPDHAWWLEQGKKYGFRFTWFVITENLMSGQRPTFSGTWADFQTLLDHGHDVQSHTLTHRNKVLNVPVEEDYAQSQKQIDENLKGTRCLTLAYPGGGLPNDPAVAEKFFAGARGGRGLLNQPSPNYLETNSMSGPASTFGDPGERTCWATILGVVEKDPRVLKNYRSWYCIHLHGVQVNEESKQKVVPPLLKLLDYVKQHEDGFWVALFREVILYGQERDTARIQVTSADQGQIRMKLTDRMYDEWYDFPLTIKVRVPNGWNGVWAAQGGKDISARLLSHEGKNYALVQAVPDRGEVLLQPAPPADVQR